MLWTHSIRLGQWQDEFWPVIITKENGMNFSGNSMKVWLRKQRIFH